MRADRQKALPAVNSGLEHVNPVTSLPADAAPPYIAVSPGLRTLTKGIAIRSVRAIGSDFPKREAIVCRKPHSSSRHSHPFRLVANDY